MQENGTDALAIQRRRARCLAMATVAIIAALAAVAATICLAGLLQAVPASASAPANAPAPSTSGMQVIEVPEDMSDEEIRAMLDAQARASSMDIAIASVMQLSDQELSVGFANDQSNRAAQRFFLEQDGTTVFASDPVEPGYELAQVQLSFDQARALDEGVATATITSVDEDGEPVGNGAQIEVQIVRTS